MRDILVTLIVIASLPAILGRPWIGILVWSWLAYMNPHRLTYGFAFDFSFSIVVGAVTILAFLVRGEKQLPKNGVLLALVVFTLFTVLTTLTAIDQDLAVEKLVKFFKIQLMTILTICLINDKQRLMALIWVIALSLGFFGLKGGTWGLLDSGENRVWGPPGSFIEDNNQLALALNMIVPLLHFLRTQARNPWVKRGLLMLMGVTAAAILMTFSRGGMLALVIVGAYLTFISRHRLGIALASVALGLALLAFLPQQWHDRMSSLFEIFEQSKKGGEVDEVDASAGSRIKVWIYSMQIANDRPLTGGGFLVQESTIAHAKYMPETDIVGRAAHSIYFEVIGEHGWLGFVLFAAVWGLTWRQTRRIRKMTRNKPELGWLYDLSGMLLVSFIAYGVSGAFLNLSTFDLAWHLIAISIIAHTLAKKALATNSAAGNPADPTHVPDSRTFATATAGGGVSGFLKKK
jgi:probable O-glycosylation ligase (exosortase A-associated)